jgi:hypothetical protein
VLFRPLLTAPGTPGTGSITGHDRSIYLWLLADDG